MQERILRFRENVDGTVIELPTPRLVELDVLTKMVEEHIYGEDPKILKLKDPIRGWRKPKTINTMSYVERYGPQLATRIIALMISNSLGAKIKPKRPLY